MPVSARLMGERAWTLEGWGGVGLTLKLQRFLLRLWESEVSLNYSEI